MKIQRGFIVPLVVILLAVLGAGSYVVVKNKNFIKQKEITKNKEAGSTGSLALNETDNWNIYKNTEFNFELKYPNSYEVKETRLGVSFNGGKQFVSIEFINESNKVALYVNKDVGGGYGACKPKVDSTTFVNTYGIKVVKNKFTNYIPEPINSSFKCEKIDDISFTYFLGGPFPKDSFELSGQLIDDKNGAQLERLADSLVQTFRLAKSEEKAGSINKNNPTSIAVGEINGLKTYNNNQYGFSFKYPTDWQISDEKTVLKLQKCFNEISFLNCESDTKVGYIIRSKIHGSTDYRGAQPYMYTTIRHPGYFEESASTGGAPTKVLSTTNLNLNDIKIVKTKKENLQSTYVQYELNYVFSKNNLNFEFSFIYENIENEQLFDELVSSLRF